MKNFRKILSLVISLAIMVTVLPLSITASAAPTSGSCGDNASWCLEGTTLYISGEGAIDDTRFSSYSNVRKAEFVMIGEGITSIGPRTFGNLRYLELVYLPTTLVTIDALAFTGCRNLSSIELPESLTTIGTRAFVGCISLKEFYIPKNVSSIADNALVNLQSLAEFTIDPENQYYSVADGVLFNKDKTKLVQYPCAKADTTYTIPSSVKEIVPIGLNLNSNLKSILTGSNTSLTSVNGVLFNNTKTKVLAYPGGKKDTSYTIPSTVKTIGESAFANAKFTSVTIPTSVNEIGTDAFVSSAIKSLTIPSSVTTLGYGVCCDCYDLVSVTLPSNLSKIPDETFLGCMALKSLTIPASVTSIGPGAFESCTSLTSINIPAKVKTIDDFTFSDCNALETVSLNEGLTEIGGDAFYGCNSLKSISMPSTLKKIGSYAFEECTGLETLNLNDGLTEIDSSAFVDCTSLKSVEIPGSVTTVEYSAFENCSALETLTFNEGTVSVIDYAFNGCSSLTSVKFPSTIKYIGYGAFFNCPLTTVYLPSGAEINAGWSDDVTDAFPENTTIEYYIPAVPLVAPVISSITGDSSSVTLNWNSIVGATSYRVYRSTTNGGTKTRLKTLAGTTYTDTTVTPGTTYYYYVEAYSSVTSSSSPMSAVRSKYVPKPSLATPVISGITSDGSSVTLSWGAISGATSYRVYRADTNGGTKTMLQTLAGTKYTDTTVTSGKTYYYYVEAYSSTTSTTSAMSAVRSKYVPKPALAAPVISSITSDGSSVTLSWGAISGATSYRVYRADTNGGTKTRLKTVAVTTYTDTTVTSGKTYYYYVEAYSSTTSTASAMSAVRSKYVPKPALAAPVISTITSDGSSVTLTWGAISGATSYRVYRSATNGGTKTRLKTIAGTTFTDTAVTPGNTYYYYVEAYSSVTSTASAMSAVRSKYVPKPALATPVISSITSDGSSVTLSWGAISGATSYRVYRADTKDGTKTRLKTVAGTTYTDTTVTASKTYYYFVEAYSSVTSTASAMSAVRSKYVI